MCLTNILNDSLTRRSFQIIITLLLLNKQITFTNSLVNYKCIKIYIIINKIVVLEICKRL